MPRTGRPPVTSRAEILTTARRLIDDDGWEKLTIRRLAAELGIGPTTLYHHVRDKEALLLLLLNEYAEQAAPPDLPGDPRERVVAAAQALHDGLAEWPWAAEVLTVDGFVGRLRAPALRLVEAILDGAVGCGLTREQAVDVFRTIWYYTVGEILVRARSARRGDITFTDFDPERVPTLAAIGERWPELVARDVYPEGLRALVGGLIGTARESD
ncbi:TetR/AcrR family transcriptional regulator [Paractinoplanes atraurantiacus]|uniref:TetR/AcrR family transcriptional regulator n=1 Tax=Paractinoplanes atraurantiacus TaxID=1036182 RepID=UPI001C54A4A7|nr:TetR/AcrR family transcriptional regulator [Actinoplanes atraurantiacus]